MRMVVANWKMNHLKADAETFCTALLASYQPRTGVEVAIAPPATLLTLVSERLKGSGIQVYAQNVHAEPKGAFTGELSVAQIQDTGATGVLLGHSERRQYNGETEATLVPKVQAARAQGLLPMLCIGETLAQRDGGATLDVLKQQLSILAQIGPGPLALAYEPVWAIGTGRVATLEQIAEVHAFIRKETVALLGPVGKDIAILYGGSVTPENFDGILAVADVAGGLVGGASLDPAKFLKLISQAQACVAACGA